jgi:methylated-DNA-protein-cysteine methyltransferase-like protein
MEHLNGITEIPINAEKRDFFASVYEVVRLIPSGRVTSYGAIANFLGSSKSSRMVGWAMNASHKLDDVPAHRVVNRNGLLTGKMHFEHPNKMEQLLKMEGVQVIDDKIIDFKDLFWDPKESLKNF